MYFDRFMNISRPYLIQDPRRLEEGNWLKAENREQLFLNHKMRAFTPIMVYVDTYDLYLYFWFERDFDKWLIDYLALSGDTEFKKIEVYEMYSQKRVDSLNEHEKGNRLEAGEKLLGDSIVDREGYYTYHLGNRKFYFVPRYPHIKVEVKWSPGGLV